MTSVVIGVCYLIRRHYNEVKKGSANWMKCY